jgi:hypothetical protein
MASSFLESNSSTVGVGVAVREGMATVGKIIGPGSKTGVGVGGGGVGV